MLFWFWISQGLGYWGNVKPIVPVGNQMELFFTGNFSKTKGIPSEVFLFARVLPDSSEYHCIICLDTRVPCSLTKSQFVA